ncbi:MAG: molybdopterin-guanine dinucleotide biosynthesis protein B [Candidatus Puniceispirillaceae bacterium]
MTIAKKAVFGLAGWSGSGKTTLAEKLIRHIVTRGFSVASIKHAHHKFDADVPGKDSWRHRKAGADQVLVSSAARSVHFIEHPEEEPALDDLVSQLKPCDLVLVEGYKKEAIPKLEIYRKELGMPPLYPEDSHIIAVMSDDELAGCTLPCFACEDIAGMADFILAHLGLERR